jgi:hypothetical protein
MWFPRYIISRLLVERLSSRKHGGDNAASFVQFGYHYAGDMDQDCDEKGIEVPVVDGQKH